MAVFITIEGIEGCGKSTLAALLKEHWGEFGEDLLITREPGGTELGRALRELLLNPKQAPVSPLTELMLFAADRAQHVSEVIKPALAQGTSVLCDRFSHSTMAYQGYGRGMNLEMLSAVINTATEGLQPDLVLLLDLEPQVGLSRVQKRSDGNNNEFAETNDRFEQQSLTFHEKVRSGFLELASDPLNKFVIIDAAQSPETVFNAAFSAIKERLG